MKLERVMGIEPTYEAWKASVLPLNYTRLHAFAFGRSKPATGTCHGQIISPAPKLSIRRAMV